MNPADWGAEIPFATIPNYNTTSSLDMTYFEANGTGYVIWAQMGAGNAIQRSTLYLAQLAPNDPSRITGDAMVITTPQYAWEMVNYMVNEGPSVLQKDGKIYVSFSASGTGVEYCLGLLTADAGSDLMEPGKLSQNRLSGAHQPECAGGIRPRPQQLYLRRRGQRHLCLPRPQRKHQFRRHPGGLRTPCPDQAGPIGRRTALPSSA